MGGRLGSMGKAGGSNLLLKDKRCLLVGGTTGVGLACARRFLEEGALVVLADRSTPRGQDALTTLGRPGRVFFLARETTAADHVDWLFEQSLTLLGGLDVLLHVPAGGQWRGNDASLHECLDDDFRNFLDMHLRGAFLANRAAVRHFLSAGKGGTILNVVSASALCPSPGHFDLAGLTASHGGIVALSKLAATRYAPERIRVNVLAVGVVDTQAAVPLTQNRAVATFLESKQPLRAGPIPPDDCGEAAVYLCSDAARSVTGQVLYVDGGWSAVEGQYRHETV